MSGPSSRLNRIANKRFNFIDTPGHTDYFSNAMRGASQIEVGVLIVDAVRYTSGLEGGNTKQLITLLRGNDVKNMIILINKMDEVGWKEERFELIKSIFEDYFEGDKSMSFKRTYIPISAYKGENLNEKVDVPWVKGNCFLKELLSVESDQFQNLDRPVRMTVKNTYKSSTNKKKGFVLTVKVESGIVKNMIGEKYIVMPRELIVSVKNMFREDEKIEFAKAGDTVDLLVQIAKEEDFESIERGSIMCTSLYPIPLVQRLVNKFQGKN